MEDDTEHIDAEYDVVQQGTHTNLDLSDNEPGLKGKRELTSLTR